MRNKIVLLVSILGFLTISLTAQEKDSTLVISGQGGGNSFISLNSVSLTAGYFEPSFGYLNSFFLPAARTSERFGGSLVYGANVSFNLPLIGERLRTLSGLTQNRYWSPLAHECRYWKRAQGEIGRSVV